MHTQEILDEVRNQYSKLQVEEGQINNYLKLIDNLLDKYIDLYLPKGQTDKVKEDKIKSEILAFSIALHKFCVEHKDLNIDFEKVIGLGGAGIIVKGQESVTGQYRAVKFPRPIEKIATTIGTEAQALSQLRHPNLILLYKAGYFQCENYPGGICDYYIMEYIPDAKNLLKYTIDKICEIKAETSQNQYISEIYKVDSICQILAYKLRETSEALFYLHRRNYVHFDIKPSNIFIIENRTILGDLGYARVKDEANTVPINIAFTGFYAHPFLREKGQLTEDTNRIHFLCSPSQFLLEWDCYAFGISILELLLLIKMAFGKNAIKSYWFRYLYLLGIRMTQGEQKNKLTAEDCIKRHHSSFPEEYDKKFRISTSLETTYPDILIHEYNDNRALYISEALQCLDKLLGYYNVIDDIPEFNLFSQDTIHCSTFWQLPITTRIRELINHSFLRRLASITQLGLIDFVFPTATHNRLQHTIGVASNCIRYINALYNDNGIPVFKQILNRDDAEGILLASLLHDIGHIGLAHDLEEILPNIYSHKRYGAMLRNEESVNNVDMAKAASEFRKFLSKYWSSNAIFVANTILNNKYNWRKAPTSFDEWRLKLYSKIVDSPIDCDKLDYLIRDAEACKIPYSNAIDRERFLSTLTISSLDELHAHNPTLAIYEKGRACAETITFVRYVMHECVYGHHTYRAIKAMLSAAARRMEDNTEKIEQLIINQIILSKDKIKKKPSSKPSPSDLSVCDNWRELAPNIIEGNRVLIEMIYELSPKVAKPLLLNIVKRNLYKRILVFHQKIQDPKDDLATMLASLKSNINAWNKFEVNMAHKLATEVINILKYQTSDISIDSHEVEELEKELRSTDSVPIIIDIPRNTATSDTPLCIVNELRERWVDDKGFYTTKSMFWDFYENQLSTASMKIRIYCIPTIYQQLQELFTYEQLVDFVKSTLKQH